MYDVELWIPTEMKVHRFDFCERECTGLLRGTRNKAEVPIKKRLLLETKRVSKISRLKPLRRKELFVELMPVCEGHALLTRKYRCAKEIGFERYRYTF